MDNYGKVFLSVLAFLPVGLMLVCWLDELSYKSANTKVYLGWLAVLLPLIILALAYLWS